MESLSLDDRLIQVIESGWQAAPADPAAAADPGELVFQAVEVPGSAGALHGTGIDPRELDTVDWWFQTEFEADAAEPGEEVVIGFGGIATVAEVYLNDALILESTSMFAEHEVDVSHVLRGRNHLAIRCRALAPLLAEPRKPRARWRSRLVSDGGLRWFRTSLLGRMPGIPTGPAVIGPWRSVRLERRRGVALDHFRLRARMRDDDGLLSVRALARSIGEALPTGLELTVDGPSGSHTLSLEATLDHRGTLFAGELRIPSVERWWPHTHGQPAQHVARLIARTADGARTVVGARRIGFRTLAGGAAADHDLTSDGLDLHVNGVAVFCRGAVWVPGDEVRFATSAVALRALLERVRDAGMNMLRVPGIGAYETELFHELCDEMGILVWQDFMFANMDYPFGEEGFRRLVEGESSAVLERLARHPSTAVLCGNSEVQQQVAMLGLDPTLGQDAFFEATLPQLARDADADAVYLPSTPFGGDLPFRTDRGVAHYYGVGGYRRPISDARAAGVRFAAECLAFANVPDDDVVATLALPPDPRWKAGVPRDAGSGWDFDDVRDHYLGLLFGVDADELRRTDPGRYLDLSRAVSGEVMAEVFGEWRRGASRSGGGLILWLQDLVPGAGWGVLDHRGSPKVAYHHARRLLQPISVWTTDEGLGGVLVHIANDGPSDLSATLRMALFRNFEQPVGRVDVSITVAAHGTEERNVESLIGHFIDASWAYRFGPPAQDVIVTSLERVNGGRPELLAQSFRFPAGRPLVVESAAGLGLEALASRAEDGGIRLSVRTRRLAYGVRVLVPGFTPSDDAFCVEPGGTRCVELRPLNSGVSFGGGSITGLNLDGHLAIRLEDGRP